MRTLTNNNLTAYMSNFNILQNKDIIFPHEETTSDNHITNEIIKSSVIVLGATFQSISDEITIDDKIYNRYKSKEDFIQNKNITIMN